MLQTMFWWVRVRKLDWPQISASLRNPARLLCLIVALLCPFGFGLAVKFWIGRSFALAYPDVPTPNPGLPLFNALSLGMMFVAIVAIWGIHAFKRYQAWAREERSRRVV